MWSIYSLSKEASTLPSQLLRIEDDYIAFCIDEVVLAWGMHVTDEIRKAGEDKKSSKQKSLEAKQERKFRSLMGQEDKKRFASPMATTAKKR